MKNLEIIDIGNNCEGIAKENGKVYFVPKTLVGEKVVAKVVKEKSNFCNCHLDNVQAVSKDRTIPQCKYYDICGGCQLQHTSYQNQLSIKKQTTQNTINKISKLNIEIDEVVASDKEFGYRNKMVFAINRDSKICMHDVDGKLFCVDKCILASEGINKILALAQEYIVAKKLKGFDEKLHRGYLRYLVVRELNDNFLITFVIANNDTKSLVDFAKVLEKNEISYGLFANINTERNSLILTEKFVYISGEKTLKGEYKTQSGKVINYPISPGSFMQVNNHIKDEIYSLVEENLKGYKFVVDAYSGAGLLTAIISQNVDYVVGIEVVKAATYDANKLKDSNGITNITNINADCVVGIDKALGIGKCEDFAVVLDPPRKGADQVVLDKVIKANPSRIIYVSCNPATLARDLAILNSSYEIKDIKLFDMFANTCEIETVVTLDRRSKR